MAEQGDVVYVVWRLAFDGAQLDGVCATKEKAVEMAHALAAQVGDPEDYWDQVDVVEMVLDDPNQECWKQVVYTTPAAEGQGGGKPMTFCPNCEDYVETKRVTRTETYTVKGRRVTVPVTSNRCIVCDESIGTDEDDQAILDAIHVAAELPAPDPS